MRQGREQGWDQGKPRKKQADRSQGEDSGMGQNHYTCEHINGTSIYSETLFSKELLAHERGDSGNKVNYTP